MNKKMITIGATVLVGLSLAACGNAKSDSSNSSSKTATSKKTVTPQHQDKKSNSSSSDATSSVSSSSAVSDSATSDSATASSASASTSTTNKINSGAEAIRYLQSKGGTYSDVQWSASGPQKDDDGNVFFACGGDSNETIALNKQNGTDNHDHMDTWVYADGRLRNPYSGEWVNY